MQYNDRLIYSLSEAAREIGCSTTTLWRKVAEGKIKVIEGFGRIRISRAELEAFINKSTVYTPRGKKRSTTE